MCAFRPRTKFNGWVWDAPEHHRTVFALSFVSCINYLSRFAIGTTVAAAMLPALNTRWTIIYKRPTAANVSCWPCHQGTIWLMDCWKVSATLILQAVNDYDKLTKQQLSRRPPPPPSSGAHVKCEVRTKTGNRIWNKMRKLPISFDITEEACHIEINDGLANRDVTVLVVINANCIFYF